MGTGVDMTVSRRLAKMMLSGIFIVNGASALENPEPLVERAEHVVPQLCGAFGIEADTEMVVRANGAMQATSALAMAGDFLPRLSAFALMLSLVPTTIAGHRFWESGDSAERAGERTQVSKNLAIAAGLLMVIVEPRRHRRGHLARKPGRAARA